MEIRLVSEENLVDSILTTRSVRASPHTGLSDLCCLHQKCHAANEEDKDADVVLKGCNEQWSEYCRRFNFPPCSSITRASNLCDIGQSVLIRIFGNPCDRLAWRQLRIDSKLSSKLPLNSDIRSEVFLPSCDKKFAAEACSAQSSRNEPKFTNLMILL